MNKLCKKCGETKPVTSFYKSRKECDGFMHRCKDCDRAYSQTRAEKKKEWNQLYVKTEAYKQRRKDKNREKTLLRMQYKIQQAALLTDDRLKKWRLNAAIRYSRRLQATPAWLDEEHRQRMRDIYAVTQQLQELTATVYHVDHIVPLAGGNVCGLHVWWNLQPLIETDNIQKGSLFDPTIFPAQGEVAFPDGAGPIAARTAVLLVKETYDT